MAIAIGTAWGYFVTDAGGTTLLFACRFSVPLSWMPPADSHDVRAILVATPSSDPGIGPLMDPALTGDLDGFIATAGSLTMHLYTNNYTPTPDSTLADFTEATWLGYASQPLPSWDLATIIGTHYAAKRSAPATFTGHT